MWSLILLGSLLIKSNSSEFILSLYVWCSIKKKNYTFHQMWVGQLHVPKCRTSDTDWYQIWICCWGVLVLYSADFMKNYFHVNGVVITSQLFICLSNILKEYWDVHGDTFLSISIGVCTQLKSINYLVKSGGILTNKIYQFWG